MNLCEEIHRELWNGSNRFMGTGERPPAEWEKIPENGLYFLFERGESTDGGDRIVRVGTHDINGKEFSGKNTLPNRLEQHFYKMNRHGSIFRKHVGRCLLRQRQEDSFLEIWNNGNEKTEEERLKVAELEQDVSNYLKENFSFVVREVNAKEDRKGAEESILSTIADTYAPSTNWLGKFHPDRRIQRNGLWNIQGVNREKSKINPDWVMTMLRNGR